MSALEQHCRITTSLINYDVYVTESWLDLFSRPRTNITSELITVRSRNLIASTDDLDKNLIAVNSVDASYSHTFP